MHAIFDTIEKPTLLLNEAAVRRNIRRMAEKARASGIRFRPHFKTHQSVEVGEWFREEGVTAITVSSVDMAVYFANHGWDDITIAFPANIRQSRTLAQLAAKIRLGLLMESAETAAALAQALGNSAADTWLKVDTGAHRTGLAWDNLSAATALAQAVQQTPNLRLRGLLTHAGQTYGGRGIEDVCRRYKASVHRIDSLRGAMAQVGPLEVSVGDTPASTLCADLGPVDELRPGNFVFYDSQQLQIGSCGWEDVAVALACPVVARHPGRGEAVIYGGAVHLSKDYLMEGDTRSYGYICLPGDDGWSAPLPGAYVSALSQEHGILKMQPKDLDRLRVGDLVCILPAHSCLTVTLMKQYRTLDGKTIGTMNE